MKIKGLLLVVLITVSSYSYGNNSIEKNGLTPEVEHNPKEEEFYKGCCNFSGSASYNDGWKFEAGFSINFGLAGPPPNGGGITNCGFGEIFFGENATHGNYLLIKTPKEYIGKTIEIMDSNFKIKNTSCGSELLQFINLKAKKERILLKETTIIRIVNTAQDKETVYKEKAFARKAVRH